MFAASDLVEALPDVVWTARADGTLTFVAERWRALTGQDPQEALGWGWLEAVDPQHRERLRAAWPPSGRNPLREAQFRIVTGDGTPRWVLVRAEPRRDASGAIAGWAGMLVDIDELRRLQGSAAELADAMPQLVWTATADGRIDYVNARWRAYTGENPADATIPEGSARVVHPDDYEAALSAWRASVRSGTFHEHAVRVRSAEDGRYRWFLTRAVAARDGASRVRRWFGTATDIEDRTRLEESLATRERQLRFLADVSAPLAAAMDVQAMLDEVVRISSTTIADWCFVYTRDETGELRIAAIGHHDPERLAAAVEASRRYPTRPGDPIVQLIDAGRTRFVPRVDSAALRAGAYDQGHAERRLEMDIASVIAVPLTVREQRVGAIVLVRGAAREPFDESDVQLAEIFAKRVTLAYENLLQYRRQQRIVDSFQRAALPKVLPRVEGLVLDAIYEAASDDMTVGGDWYDAFPIADGRLVMTIGDVAGKGLDAAVLMANVRQAIRVAALQNAEPATILNAADTALQLEYPDRFVTAFIAIVDPRSWTIAYAAAGHPAPLVRRPDGTLLALEGAGLPLGAPLDVARRTRSIAAVPPGSLIVLFTDGLIESTRDVLEGERRLRDALENDALLHSAAPAHLLRDMILYDGVRDDVAILTLTLGRATHWSFESRDAVAAQSARSSFVAALARVADPESDLGSAELIFGELVSNVVRYAPGAIEIDLEWVGSEPILHVLDRGSGFDLHSTLPDDVMSERGRGLYIVSVLGRDVRADRLPGRGNHVRVTLPVRRKV